MITKYMVHVCMYVWSSMVLRGMSTNVYLFIFLSLQDLQLAVFFQESYQGGLSNRQWPTRNKFKLKYKLVDKYSAIVLYNVSR